MNRISSDDKKPLIAFGIPLDINGAPIREYVKQYSGDYGSDPIGNGMFRMVPSGDIVNHDERNKRLKGKQ